MSWDRVKKHLTWITIAPLIILGYGQLASLVYFIDWVEFARDIVTQENMVIFEQIKVNVEYLLDQVEKLKELHPESE